MSTTQNVKGKKWFEIFTERALAPRQEHWLSRLRLGLWIAPLIFILFLVLFKLEFPRWYRFIMITEDGPIESLTAVTYLIACYLAFSLGRRLHRQGQRPYGIIYMLLSVGFFLIGMEEISWGQRIFHLATPQFFMEHNYQHEINVHNFASRYVLHASYVLVGAYGAFAFLVLPERLRKRFKNFVDFCVPPWFLSTYFLPICLMYLYYDLGEQFGLWSAQASKHYFIGAKDQEPIEFILSLGFLLFVWIQRGRLTFGRSAWVRSLPARPSHEGSSSG